MMLSNACKYAIRAVIYLAVNTKNNEKIGIKKIASEMSLPTPFLGKILQSLAKKGILNSTKGPNGGFALGSNFELVTFYDIINIVDGNDNFGHCFMGLEMCQGHPEKQKYCPLHEKSEPLKDEIIKLFQSNTIIEVAEQIRAVKGNFQI
jgi:Rrf2 family protein